MPSETWARLNKFTVERHPYEKVVSKAYYWKGVRKSIREEPIEAIIDRVVDTESYLNYPLYTIDGKLVVDRVLRFEDLERELNEHLTELGAPSVAGIGRAKGGFRSDRAPAREILTPGQREKIRAAAGFEFDLMGYES